MPLVVFVAVLGLRAQFASRATLPDDAFITYRYAANLAHGQGFVYNRGERVLGTTTPLLTVILAAARRIGCEIPNTGRVIAVIASAAGAALLVAVALAATGSVPVAIGVAVLTGLSTYEAQIGAGGMEPPLLVAMMLGSFLLLVRERYAWGALLAALAALTRPEGFLWWALYGLYLGGTGKLSRAALAAGLAPIAAWFGFALVYFGSPLPHTVVAKVLQGQSPMARLTQPWQLFAFALGRPRYLPMVLAAPSLMWRHERRLALPLLFSAIFLAGYQVARPMMYPWYGAPLNAMLGLTLVFVLDGALRLWEAPAAGGRRWLHRGWTLLVVASFLLLVHSRAQLHWMLLTQAPPPEWRQEMARTVGRHTGPQDVILVGDIGYLGYYNLDRHLVDTYGLVWQAPRALMAAAMSQVISDQFVSQAIAAVQPTVYLPGMTAASLAPPPGYAIERWPDLPGWKVLRRTAP